MVGTLQRALVCSPRAAGWEAGANWRELGFLHAPNFQVAQSQHDQLCNQLQGAGVDVIHLRPASDCSLDCAYTHDASLTTDYGMILMYPGKPNRVAEARAHGEFCRGLGIPIFGQVAPPGTSEGGDIVWLDSQTLLVGNGYRTNPEGIAALRDLLAPKAVEVIAAPLPHGGGPAVCLHLMSLMSMLDDRTILVDLSWLAVETVKLLRNRGFSLIEIEPSERDSMACNVLSLGAGRLIAIEENRKTNDRLRAAGFDVRTFSGDELCINGGGGPTCLTRPLLRS
jgi:N-dimethylarginine dimethylaminohydrolase